MEERIWSVKQAAELMGINAAHLRRLLAKGEVKGKKLNGTWVVLSLDYKRKREPKIRKGIYGTSAIEVYRQDVKKLKPLWQRVDQILDALKADKSFTQYDALVELLDYIRKSTNRVKLGIDGTKISIAYPMETSMIINAKDRRWIHDEKVQSGFNELGTAIAELQALIKDLNNKFRPFVQDAEYTGYKDHWSLIDNWTKGA